MSVHTRTRHTRSIRKKLTTSFRKKRKNIPWREVAKANIKKYTEAGLAVRGGRYKAGLTQAELAKKLGILPHHVSEMEYGKRPISKKMAHKLAEVFDVNYKVFL